MPPYRSRTTTHGRNMAGARGLWRATGMQDSDFGKPIIAVVNSFTQFVPGHVHLKDLGQLVTRAIERSGGVAKEFNTIAIDDGIAMGHDGMLYSLPSRELIADSVEYMANAHCADALVCISNCDKITPGMLMASLRLNIPTIFVSGGPMEAGKVVFRGKQRAMDLVDAMVAAADDSITDAEVATIERSACPTCGSCSGMFTANSMNCLTEALGLSLPGNGSLLATHADRRGLFLEAGRLIVELTKRYYEFEDSGVLPRSIANFNAFENAMTLDIAMGGSTNTVLHLLAAAHEAEVAFGMNDIDRHSRRIPCLCKVAPAKSDVHMEDVHRAGGIMAILGELNRAGLLHLDVSTVHAPTLGEALARWDVKRTNDDATRRFYRAAPGGVPTQTEFSQDRRFEKLDLDRQQGTIRDRAHAFSQDGGLAVLFGNIAQDGSIVKTAGVDETLMLFAGRARVFESQDAAVAGILGGKVVPGDEVVIRYEGPRGGPGMQEMLYPTSYLVSKGLGKVCALITDGRFSGGGLGPLDLPYLTGSGRGRRPGVSTRRRHHRSRHSAATDKPGSRRFRTTCPTSTAGGVRMASSGAERTTSFQSPTRVRCDDNQCVERCREASLTQLQFTERGRSIRMSGEWKDIAVIIDGRDPPADRARAAAALRLSHHHGAHLSVFEQGSADDFDRLILNDIADDAPYAGVEFCGIENHPLPGRHHRQHSSLTLLRRVARDAGAWATRSDGAALLGALRCADLVITGSPLVSDDDATQDAEDIVARSGRPVLMIPREFALRSPEQRKIGHRALVAWNATAPSTRAAHDALPLLRQAEKVLLLFVDHHDSPAAKSLTMAMSEHLKRHGVSVRSEVVTRSLHSPTAIILNRISDRDIDLLVMGAFSRSRLAETWFGGVSVDLLRSVDTPILTSH